MNIEIVRQELIERLGEEYEVEIINVTKTNDAKMLGLCINKVNSRIAPTVYVNEDDPRSEADIASELYDIYMNEEKGSKLERLQELAERTMGDADSIYENAYPVLINKRFNEEYLEQVVNREFFADLVIIYKVMLDTDGNSGSHCITITKGIAEARRLDLDVLHERACKNSEKIKSVESILSVIARLRGIDIPANPNDPMWVVSNESGVLGASSIVLNSTMQFLHERLGEKVIVIPSSIHEVIAVSGDADGVDLNGMINEVNMTSVNEREWLSDKAYVHTKEKGWEVA